MKNPGKITIHHTRGTVSGPHRFTIEIFDDQSRTKFLQVTMPAEFLLLALAGHPLQPCELDFNHIERIGLIKQTKIRHLPRQPAAATIEQLRQITAPHEEDGWEPDLADFEKPSRRVDGEMQAITFNRWIKPQE